VKKTPMRRKPLKGGRPRKVAPLPLDLVTRIEDFLADTKPSPLCREFDAWKEEALRLFILPNTREALARYISRPALRKVERDELVSDLCGILEQCARWGPLGRKEWEAVRLIKIIGGMEKSDKHLGTAAKRGKDAAELADLLDRITKYLEATGSPLPWEHHEDLQAVLAQSTVIRAPYVPYVPNEQAYRQTRALADELRRISRFLIGAFRPIGDVSPPTWRREDFHQNVLLRILTTSPSTLIEKKVKGRKVSKPIAFGFNRSEAALLMSACFPKEVWTSRKVKERLETSAS